MKKFLLNLLDFYKKYSLVTFKMYYPKLNLVKDEEMPAPNRQLDFDAQRLAYQVNLRDINAKTDNKYNVLLAEFHRVRKKPFRALKAVESRERALQLRELERRLNQRLAEIFDEQFEEATARAKRDCSLYFKNFIEAEKTIDFVNLARMEDEYNRVLSFKKDWDNLVESFFAMFFWVFILKRKFWLQIEKIILWKNIIVHFFTTQGSKFIDSIIRVENFFVAFWLNLKYLAARAYAFMWRFIDFAYTWVGPDDVRWEILVDYHLPKFSFFGRGRYKRRRAIRFIFAVEYFERFSLGGYRKIVKKYWQDSKDSFDSFSVKLAELKLQRKKEAAIKRAELIKRGEAHMEKRKKEIVTWREFFRVAVVDSLVNHWSETFTGRQVKKIIFFFKVGYLLSKEVRFWIDKTNVLFLSDFFYGIKFISYRIDWFLLTVLDVSGLSFIYDAIKIILYISIYV